MKLLSFTVITAIAAESTIRELVNQLEGKVSWKVGYNAKFDLDKKPSDYAYLMGTLQEPEHMKLPALEIDVLKDIPASFDPRDQWGSMCKSLNEIRDQGTCGSCWAFGAAESLTDRACIQSNGQYTVDYSTEDILSCCSTCGFGCNGGYLSSSWQYFQRTGVCTGGLYEGTGCRPYSIQGCAHHNTESPYQDCSDLPSSKTPACTKSCQSSYTTATYSNDILKTQSAYSVGSSRKLETIQTELMTNGPIEVSFTVYEDFMTYTGGVYYHQTGKSLGGHAIKLMGWGTDEDTGMDYWLLANSWDTYWGENGFFRMRRGTNECGLENSGVAGMVFSN